MFHCFFIMDWLTFQFYIVIWVLCTSEMKAELSNPEMPHCVPGQPVPSPDKCNSCICYEGETFCTKLPCPAPACENGETLPNPDPCNKCMCNNNKVACSDLICIPAPQCIEKKQYPSQNKCNVCMCLRGHIMCTTNTCTIKNKVVPETFAINETIVDDSGEGALAAPLQPPSNLEYTIEDRIGSECDNNQRIYRPDDCNECYCFESRLVCSDLICIRGSKCVEGQEIPKPDSCNFCKCVETHIVCTNHKCPDTISKNSFRTESTSTQLEPLEQCKPGDAIPPPPPPNDCNTCTCLDNRVVCSQRECHDDDFVPEIKTRFITAEEENNEHGVSECVDGQELSKPDSCNYCICIEGHVICTKHHCPDTISKNSFGSESTSTPLEPFEQCKPGEAIPPPPPPNDCNTCTCLDNRVVCSQRECHDDDFVPEIKTRFITAEEEKIEHGVSECVDGQELPKPDSCNYCICIEGHIICTKHHCPDTISKNSFGSESTSTQLKPLKQCNPGDAIPPPPPPNDCNTCTCLDNRVVCSQRECHDDDFVPEIKTRFITAEEEKNEHGVSECVDGQELPKPDSCNYCICIEGHVLCTNRKCPVRTSKNLFQKESTLTELESFEQCNPGDAIPPPPPPNDCNTCTCLDYRVVCSQRECHDVDFVSEFKTRFITGEEENNEHGVSECVDGQELPNPDSCNYCKCIEEHILCTIYICSATTSRNSFGSEIKTRFITAEDEKIEHSSKLKEFDKQLSVEPIVDMLLKSRDKRPSKLVRTHAYNGFQQEIKVHSGQLSKDTARLLKAIASSLHSPALADIGDKLLYEKTHQFISNNGDTINLSTKNSFDLHKIPVTQTSKIITSGSQGNETILVIPELLSEQSHVSITPIMTHHETIWNTVASPPPIVSKNAYEMYSHGSKAKNLPENQDGSSILTIEKHKIVSNLNKFDHSGQEHVMTLPRIMVTTPTGNSHSENLAFQISPNPTNGNNGRPYAHHNDQYEALQYKTRAKYSDSSVTPTSDYTLVTSSYKQSPEYEIYKIAPKNPHTTSIAIQLNQNSINGNGNGNGIGNGKPNQVVSRFTESNVVPVTTYTLLTSRYKPRQDKGSYHNAQQLDTNISKMTVHKMQMNPEVNRYVSNVNTSPQPMSFPNNQQRPRDILNDRGKQFKPTNKWISSNQNVQSPRGEQVLLNNRYKQTTKFPSNSPQIHLNEIKNVNDDKKNPYLPHYTTDINPSPRLTQPEVTYTITHTTSPKSHPIYHDTVNHKRRPTESRHQSQYGKHSTITYLSELDPILNGKLQVRHDSYKTTYVPNKQRIVKNNMPVVVQKIKGTYDNEPKLNHHPPDDPQEFLYINQQNNVSPAMPADHKYNPPGPMNKLRVDKHIVPPRSHQFTPDLTRSEINPLIASYPNVVGQPPYPAQSQMKFPPTQSETAHLNPVPTNVVPGGVLLENNSQKRFKIKPLRFVKLVKKPHSTPSRHFKNPYLPSSVDHNPNNNFLNSDNANQNPLHHNRLPNNLPYQNLPVSPNGEESPLKHHYKPHHSGNNPHVGHKNPLHFNPNQPQSIQKPQPHFGTPYNHHESRDGVTPQSVGFPNRANTVPHNHIPDRNINQPPHSQASPGDIPRGPGVVNSPTSPAPVVGPLTLPEGPSIPKGFINQPPNYNPELYPPRINPNQYPNYQPRPQQNPGLNPLNANKNPNIYTDSQPHQRPHPQEAIHNNENQNKYTIPNLESPQQSQIEPGLLDHHKTYDDYQYPINSSEYLPHSLESLEHYPLKAQFPPISNQPTSGISGPDFAYQYLPPRQTFESSQDPHEPQSVDSYPNKNQPLELTKDQQTSENIDSNEPFDVKVSKHTLDNLHTPPQIPFEPYPNENGLEFTDGGKNPNSKEYNDPHSPHLQPIQENPQTSGNLDDLGSNDDYFLPEHNSPQNTFEKLHKENGLEVFDDTSEGSNYPPSSVEDITHSNNLSEQPHSNTSPTKTPDFNVQGPDTGSEYIPESTEGTSNTKRPVSETEIPHDFDDPGSGGAYASNSEDQNKSPWKPQISSTISPRNSWSPKEVDKIHESGNAATPELNPDYKELKDNRAGIWNPIELDNSMLDLNPNVLANMLSVANDTKNLDKVYPSLILLIKNLSKLELNSSELVDSDLDQVDFLPVLLSILVKYQNEINKVKHKQYNNNNSILKLLKEITANKYKPEDEIDVQTIYDMVSKLPTLNINITNTKVTDDDVEGYLIKLIHNIQEKALVTTTHPGNEKITITTKFKTSQPADSHTKYQDLLNILQEFQEGDPWDLLALVNNLTVDNVSQGDDEPIQSRFSNPKPPQYMFKHKVKDQKEECGDGTAWFKNCHECSCQSGHAYCSKVPGCVVRPVGEPMMCKPYTQFNMSACYICECNADGIPECNGSPCVGQSPSMDEEMHKGKEFFDEEKTKEIIEYYNIHKKLPKYCSDLRLLYPTCKPGSSWISDCHDCTCNDKGQRECTKIEECEMPNVHSYGEPTKCKPNSKFYPKSSGMPCKECSCDDNGEPHCPTNNPRK